MGGRCGELAVAQPSLQTGPTSSVRESERERIADAAWTFDTDRQRTVMMIVEAQSARQCHLAVPMQSAKKVMHRDTQRRLNDWVKGVMADTPTSISRRRGTALVLVNPAYTSQIDSRTGLLQGARSWDRFYGLDGVVLDADTNAARNILARLYDDEIMLYTPFPEVKRLLRDRSGQRWGRLHPDSSPPTRPTPPDGRERMTPNP